MLEGDLPVPAKKSFNTPDKILDAGLEQTGIITIGDITFKRRILKPGWRGIENNEGPLVQLQLTGRMHIRAVNGTDEEFRPGDVGIIPARYDSWVEGDKRATILEISEQKEYTELELEKEKRAITMRGEDFIAAMNGRNPREAANIFAERADFINAAGRILHGRPAIERYFGTYLQNLLPGNGLFKVYDNYTRNIGPALVNANLYWTFIEANNLYQLEPHTVGLFNLLLAKARGEWSILMMHSIDLTEVSAEEEEID